MKALRLKDLGRWYSGGTPPRDRPEHWDGDVPWISAKDIDSTRLRPATTFITHEAALEHSRMVPAGALLVIVRGMALAHGLPVVETGAPVAFNQDLRALVCERGIEPRFVYYSLIGHRWRLNAHVDQAAHGTARVNDSIYGERIEVPDRSAQQAVAGFLDRECTRIDDLVDAAGAMNASLYAACRETFARLTAGAPQIRLRFALRSIEQGWSPVCDSREVEEGEWGVLKLGCVNGGAFRDLHKALADGLTPRPELEVHDGNLLMSRANTRDLVGSAAVVTRIRPSLMLSDLLYRLHLDDGWEPVFLATAIGTARVRAQIEAIAEGSAGSMPKLNQESIKNLRVPCLPPAEQRIVIEASDQAAAAPRAAIAECDALEAQLHAYRDALITEAVTGQLDVTRLSEAQMEEDLDAVRQGERPEVLAT